VPEKADPRLAQGAYRAGRPDPGLDLAPGTTVVAGVEQAGDNLIGDAGAGEGSGELGGAAGRAVGQPLAGVGVGIVQRGDGLQVEHDDGDPGTLHRGEDLAGGGVGGGVQ